MPTAPRKHFLRDSGTQSAVQCSTLVFLALIRSVDTVPDQNLFPLVMPLAVSLLDRPFYLAGVLEPFLPQISV